MNDIFTTADTHFFHDKIVELSSRPFRDYREMHDKIIENWNSVVKPGDRVIHVGDFALTWNKKCYDKIDAILRHLNGNKILVTGNHDREAVTRSKYWDKVTPYYEIKFDNGGEHKQRVCFFHYSLRVWNQMHRGSWMLYGHSHGNLPQPPGWTKDVGVDDNNFTPQNLRTDITEFMARRPMIAGDDHHTSKETT